MAKARILGGNFDRWVQVRDTQSAAITFSHLKNCVWVFFPSMSRKRHHKTHHENKHLKWKAETKIQRHLFLSCIQNAFHDYATVSIGKYTQWYHQAESKKSVTVTVWYFSTWYKLIW